MIVVYLLSKVNRSSKENNNHSEFAFTEVKLLLVHVGLEFVPCKAAEHRSRKMSLAVTHYFILGRPVFRKHVLICILTENWLLSFVLEGLLLPLHQVLTLCELYQRILLSFHLNST